MLNHFGGPFHNDAWVSCFTSYYFFHTLMTINFHQSSWAVYCCQYVLQLYDDVMSIIHKINGNYLRQIT